MSYKHTEQCCKPAEQSNKPTVQSNKPTSLMHKIVSHLFSFHIQAIDNTASKDMRRKAPMDSAEIVIILIILDIRQSNSYACPISAMYAVSNSLYLVLKCMLYLRILAHLCLVENM